jgi:DNA-binding MarR family transcriptional regulator
VPRDASPRRPRPLLLDIWVAGELLAAVLDRRLADDGVDPYAWGTLSVIGALGPLTPSELAARTGRPLTTVSDLVRKLVERGDVERLPNPEDGRSHVLRVTKRGDQRWRAGWPALQATVSDIEGNLERHPDEVHDALEDLLGALRTTSRTLNTIP